MPHKLPDAISQTIQSQMPATHKMWWMRGLILNFQHIQSDEGLASVVPAINTKVQILDVDTNEGHDLILMGEGFDFVNGDIVSLFGHEPIQAQNLSSARFIINHNTGQYARAYPELLFYPTHWHFADFKHRLACKTTLSAGSKSQKTALIIGGFLLSGCVTMGATFILAGIIAFVGIPFLVTHHLIKRAASQPAFQGEKKRTVESNLWVQFQDFLGTKYQNVTPIYEKISGLIDNWVIENPDEDKGFVAVHRGRGQRGKLVE